MELDPLKHPIHSQLLHLRKTLIKKPLLIHNPIFQKSIGKILQNQGKRLRLMLLTSTLKIKPNILTQTKLNATSLYEWNIDRMFEYNIINLLQQMIMIANAYKT